MSVNKLSAPWYGCAEGSVAGDSESAVSNQNHADEGGAVSVDTAASDSSTCSTLLPDCTQVDNAPIVTKPTLPSFCEGRPCHEKLNRIDRPQNTALYFK